MVTGCNYLKEGDEIVIRWGGDSLLIINKCMFHEGMIGFKMDIE